MDEKAMRELDEKAMRELEEIEAGIIANERKAAEIQAELARLDHARS